MNSGMIVPRQEMNHPAALRRRRGLLATFQRPSFDVAKLIQGPDSSNCKCYDRPHLE